MSEFRRNTVALYMHGMITKHFQVRTYENRQSDAIFTWTDRIIEIFFYSYAYICVRSIYITPIRHVIILLYACIKIFAYIDNDYPQKLKFILRNINITTTCI